MVEFYDKYITRLETEGNGPELLAELSQEAIKSLREYPPEQALTLLSQMVGALLTVARLQEPPEQGMVDTINELTAMMVDYVEHLGWHQWAVKTETGWIYSKSPVHPAINE